MKKIFFLLALVLGCASSQAQVIKVYNNNTLVNTYTNDGNNNYKVVASKGNTHEMVDLGLSVKWATCNIGAETAYDAGDYFAWGETSPKDYYYSITYKYCSCSNNEIWCGDASHYTKYNSNDSPTVLDSEDDAATVIWGSGYRMPTKEEWAELYSKCNWTWDSTNKGYVVSGNGNSIFLPAAANRWAGSVGEFGALGPYWSSSLNTSDYSSAYNINIKDNNNQIIANQSSRRYDGFPIRPVAK